MFEAVEVADELLLLLKKDHPFIIPPEADPEPEVDEPDPDVSYLFEVEDEVLCPRCGRVVTDFLPYPKFRKSLLS